MRFILQLRGTDGTLPALDLGGTSQVRGQEVRITYQITNEDKELRIKDPVVTRTSAENEGFERWTVAGDSEKVREVIEGKLRSLAAQGKQMRSDSGQVLSSGDVDALLKDARREEIRPGIVKTISVDLPGCVRFFAKLALATGHFVHGETFSRSAGANVLRRAMRAHDEQGTTIPHAFVWPKTVGLEHVFAPFQRQNSHVLALLDFEPPVFIASLFGTYNAFIPLGHVDSDKPPKTSDTGRVFHIALPSRRVRDLALIDYLAQLIAERRKRNIPKT